MPAQDPIALARMLIDRHGLRAGAVAQERVAEARLAGRTVESTAGIRCRRRWPNCAAPRTRARRRARCEATGRGAQPLPPPLPKALKVMSV